MGPGMVEFIVLKKSSDLKIVTIVPGFGGTFYCGNCLRDSGYNMALRAAGHEPTTIPIYLPLSIDHVDRNENVPVFYGAIGIYLKQQYKLFRHMPKWMESFFNAPFFMRMAAKRAGSTRASGLEDMTISMLKGHEGKQAEDLEVLIDYLKNHEQPDIIHLSNALLLGLAGRMKEELSAAVVCSLQDEDVWIDAMRPEYVEGLWKLMEEKAKDVDAFISVSNYFSTVMQQKMNIPPEKLHTVHIGIDPEEYKFQMPEVESPVIGYMSRMNQENGFGLIIDAFIRLKKNTQCSRVKLRVTGGSTGDDRKYIKKQKRKLKEAGVLDQVEFMDAYEGASKKDFLSALSLLSVPVLNGEAFGLYQLEAMASGTPIIQPSLGAFPEIVEATGGGLIYDPNTPEALEEKLRETLCDKKNLEQLAMNGRKGVEEKFNMNKLIEKMLSTYRQAIEHKNGQV